MFCCFLCKYMSQELFCNHLDFFSPFVCIYRSIYLFIYSLFPSEFASFNPPSPPCRDPAVTCKPELSRPLKATAVLGIWTGQKINWPHGCLKAQRKQLHGVYQDSPHKICQPPTPCSSQSSNNDPIELWSGVTTQMTLHCVLMTWDVVAG